MARFRLRRCTELEMHELEARARALGYALVPLKILDGLADREHAVADAEERGRDLRPLLDEVTRICNVEFPRAVEDLKDAHAEIAALNGRLERAHVSLLVQTTHDHDPFQPMTAR